jgi:hypothetical protein
MICRCAKSSIEGAVLYSPLDGSKLGTLFVSVDRFYQPYRDRY